MAFSTSYRVRAASFIAESDFDKPCDARSLRTSSKDLGVYADGVPHFEDEAGQAPVGLVTGDGAAGTARTRTPGVSARNASIGKGPALSLPRWRT